MSVPAESLGRGSEVAVVGPLGTPQHATMICVTVMVVKVVYGYVVGRWTAAARFAGLAVVGHIWARRLGRHPD
jgi:hypothetical protein